MPMQALMIVILKYEPLAPSRVHFGTNAPEGVMRWWLPVVVPMCLGFGSVPGSTALVEIGVLACTLGHAVDTIASAQTSAASEAREMACAFKPARNGPEETYAGIVKAIGESEHCQRRRRCCGRSKRRWEQRLRRDSCSRATRQIQGHRRVNHRRLLESAIAASSSRRWPIRRRGALRRISRRHRNLSWHRSNLYSR